MARCALTSAESRRLPWRPDVVAMTSVGSLVRCALALAVVLTAISCDGAGPGVSTTPPNGAPLRIEALDVGEAHACVLVSDGSVYCWGLNNYGEVGYLGDGPTPKRVENVPPSVALKAGPGYTCSESEARALWCWGDAFGGKFGEGLGGPTPVEVASGENADAFALGVNHICKVQVGAIVCWGSPYGSGSSLHTAEPVDALSRGYPTCALTSTSGVLCWGGNSDGQLGNGTTSPQDLPGQIQSPGEGIVALASASFRVFAVGQSGTVYAWGHNGPEGALGLGDTKNRSAPTPLGGIPPMRTVDGGAFHACAASQAGKAYCWGRGMEGQLGTGEAVGSLVPVPVSFDIPVLDIAVGAAMSCLLTHEREVYCFGTSPLGDGTYNSSTVPVRIHFPWETVDSDAGAGASGP
jgi:alpha-tubulin suppressor-like RCC1 family protein